MATARKTTPRTSTAPKTAGTAAAKKARPSPPSKSAKAASAAGGLKPTDAAPARTAAVPPKKSAASPAARAGAPAAKGDKADKARKPKLVRDSFTIPKNEYGVLDTLKARAARLGAPAKKSEVLRAGIMVLAALDDGAFTAAMRAVPAVKTGRPAKD